MSRLMGAVLLSALLQTTCDVGSPFRSQGCNLRGCGLAFDVRFARQAAWSPGTYTVEVIPDGVAGTCTVTFPLDCARASQCTGVHNDWGLGESSCALSAAGQSLSGVSFQTRPASVTIKVSQADAVLGQGTFSPVYHQSQPNGPDCEPTCTTAPGETLVVR